MTSRMDEQTRSRIFEPFFTTKGPGKGTGLGLAMVYGFIQQSRGLIHVSSEPGTGTTFRIYFPKAAAAEERLAAPARAAIVGGRETVLVVEDEESLRLLAEELHQAMGYTVLSADSGSKALEGAQQYPNKIDLLLTDVIMPNMSGRELALRLTSLRPEVKVLYMSGYTNDVIVQHQLLAPHEAFLHKPFTREELASKIRQLLDSQSSAPSQGLAMLASNGG